MKATLLLIALVLVVGVRADTPDADAIAAAAERAIERAYLRASATELAEAIKPLEAALVANPNHPALLYERAFAHYAGTATLRDKNDKDAILAEFEQATALLERVRGQPWEAEAAGLHGSILGNVIGLKGRMSAMRLGPKSVRLIARAAKALPNSPRVMLFQGLSLLHTPPMFGGNAEEGAQRLQQAVDLFAAGQAGASNGGVGPQWGHADALVWLGLVKKNAGDLAAARVAWAQALELEPDHNWVKSDLWPSLAQNSAK